MTPGLTVHRDIGPRDPMRAIGRRPDGLPSADAVTFCVLRLLAQRGPLSAIEVATEVRPLGWLVGPSLAQPILPLLHTLEDRGLVVATGERPPRYEISADGLVEGQRLAAAFWPTVAARIARIDARVALLFELETHDGSRAGDATQAASSE